MIDEQVQEMEVDEEVKGVEESLTLFNLLELPEGFKKSQLKNIPIVMLDKNLRIVTGVLTSFGTRYIGVVSYNHIKKKKFSMDWVNEQQLVLFNNPVKPDEYMLISSVLTERLKEFASQPYKERQQRMR